MPSPLDGVLAGASDVTSPTPVDTSSLPVQTPQDQIVAPPPDVAGAAADVQPSAQPDVNSASAQPAQPPAAAPRTVNWRSLLVSALQGLALNGPVGLVRGPVSDAVTGSTPFEQKRAQISADAQDAAIDRQNKISTIRFRDAQTAHTLLDNIETSHHIALLPQEDQQALFDANQKTVSFLKGQGFSFDTTYDPSSDTSNVAMLHSVGAVNGGTVPHIATFQVAPNMSLVFSGNNQTPQTMVDGLDTLSWLNNGIGLTGSQKQSFLAMSHDAQQKMLADAANRMTKLPPDPMALTVLRDQTQNAINNLKQHAAWKTDLISALQSRLDAINQAIPNTTALKNEFEQRKAQYQAAAKAAEAQRKADATMYEGTDARGNEVAGTADELHNAGVSNYTKMPALIQNQTLAARDLTAPNGLFAQARAQILALNKAGKLGAVASRYNNFWAKKGMDGEQQAFRDTLALIATKLMQAHIGNRGGKDAMEHFANLVPENSTPAALMSTLNGEYQYVVGLAKRPKAVSNGQ